MNADQLIIANCSGFFGDRITAAEEMVNGGEIDVLTGDYLAELTMAILFQQKMKKPDSGYVGTFLKQMKAVMRQCLDRKIKVVSNAGGLNPQGLARALTELAGQLGVSPKIAWIEGDDLMPRLKDLQAAGEPLAHLDRGIALADSGGMPVSANAYLGGWGITEALKRGADIVVCGRVADAALISGPCAWHFNWAENDWDRLAGAYAAGHVIECGAQATGGNYSFLDEVPDYSNVGFPLAVMYPDGSSVITKHEGTGGLVSVGTVTAQLMYEIRTPAYLTPDVRARFDTLKLTPDGENRVRLSGVRGEPAPDTTKVCLNIMSGYRNSMTVVLTGLDIEKKARIVEETLWKTLGGKERFGRVNVQLIRFDKENPPTNEEAFAHLKITVMDADPAKVGRAFSSALVEMALASIPGFTMTHPPDKESPVICHWPALIANRHISQTVHVDDQVLTIPPVPGRATVAPVPVPAVSIPEVPGGPTRRVPLGRLFATRSGDKGGNANLGVWAKSPEAFAFLRQFLTVDRLRDLLPDIRPFAVERHELANLLAVNFYIQGLLGDGAAASWRNDPQAKTLGEYLRAKMIEVPVKLLS
ncbi:MAG: acyclic terpene utilization AtuA family protein [Thermodesulfobacteriota bacterium]